MKVKIPRITQFFHLQCKQLMKLSTGIIIKQTFANIFAFDFAAQQSFRFPSLTKLELRNTQSAVIPPETLPSIVFESNGLSSIEFFLKMINLRRDVIVPIWKTFQCGAQNFGCLISSLWYVLRQIFVVFVIVLLLLLRVRLKRNKCLFIIQD